MARSNAGRRGSSLDRLCQRGSTARGPVAKATPAPVEKLLVVGGPGGGKSTVVAAVSEIGDVMAEAAPPADPGRATTVAMDFGRITVDGEHVFLFGTPGHARFGYMWDLLARGAGGALLVADARRLTESAPALAFLRRRRLPFVVLVNLFDGTESPSPHRVRDALALPAAVPVLTCDARALPDVRRALVTALAHLRSGTRTAPASVPPHLNNNRCGLPLTAHDDQDQP